MLLNTPQKPTTCKKQKRNLAHPSSQSAIDLHPWAQEEMMPWQINKNLQQWTGESDDVIIGRTDKVHHGHVYANINKP